MEKPRLKVKEKNTHFWYVYMREELMMRIMWFSFVLGVFVGALLGKFIWK